MSESPAVVFSGKKFRIVRHTVTTDRGNPKTREIVDHPGACVVVPLVGDDHVCLIRNYRIAAGETLIELPAGTLEPGEPPHITAERELIEETGYRAAKIEFLHAFFLSPGILNEKMHLYLATGLTAGETAREEGEEIENLLVPWSEALSMIFSGQIKDAKTIVGLLWADRLRKG
ncbi:MAG: NUDIX hydrolase [Pirellulaceae bacterium]|nr:NUDIX hydrolase [Pirellulaceae bacterium]